MLTLGIDGGATAAKWALRDDSGKIKEGVSEPIDGHTYRPESKARLVKVLNEIKAAAGNEKISAIYAGITGTSSDPENNGEIIEIFQSIFGEIEIEIVIDMVLGYRAHFDFGEGIFLYAGTGSIATYLTETGKVVRAGGWGYLLGDEGAGYWIGREAIRRTLTAIDTKSAITKGSLEAEVLDFTKCKDWNGIKEFVYSKDRSAIAALAKPVISLAKNGELAAQDILAIAADYLIDLVLQIESVVAKPDLPVIFAGGITEAGDFIIDLINIGIGREVSLSKVRIANRAAEIAAENLA